MRRREKGKGVEEEMCICIDRHRNKLQLVRREAKEGKSEEGNTAREKKRESNAEEERFKAGCWDLG